MPEPKAKSATYADIEALPPHVVGEILNGVLHTHPRPGPPHGIAQTVLGTEVAGPYQLGRGGPGGWIFIIEPELHLGPHVVVPDIAGWRRERLHLPLKTAFIETPPDWVAEVLSPSTARIDRTDKLSIYAAFGVGHAWYVDPIARTLEVFALQGGAGADAEWASEAPNRKWTITVTFKDDDAVTAPPFEAHTFTLAALWAE